MTLRIAKEAHERRKTQTQVAAAENQEGTRGEATRSSAGRGTPADPMST